MLLFSRSSLKKKKLSVCHHFHFIDFVVFLSTASSHKPFVLNFSKPISQPNLARSTLEACDSGSSSIPTGENIFDVATAIIALKFHLLVNLLDGNASTTKVNQLLDCSSACRILCLRSLHLNNDANVRL